MFVAKRPGHISLSDANPECFSATPDVVMVFAGPRMPPLVFYPYRSPVL